MNKLRIVSCVFHPSEWNESSPSLIALCTVPLKERELIEAPGFSLVNVIDNLLDGALIVAAIAEATPE